MRLGQVTNKKNYFLDWFIYALRHSYIYARLLPPAETSNVNIKHYNFHISSDSLRFYL